MIAVISLPVSFRLLLVYHKLMKLDLRKFYVRLTEEKSPHRLFDQNSCAALRFLLFHPLEFARVQKQLRWPLEPEAVFTNSEIYVMRSKMKELLNV